MMRYWRLLEQSHPSLKFAMVGGFGFLVDTSVMIVLFEGLEVRLAIARCTAFICAASSNWILNRVFTFRERDLAGRKSLEWIRFIVSALLSAIPNLGIFFLLMQVFPESLVYIIFAMCCGILAGYFTNYQLARLWVYRSRRH
jgi:putative flippase GtrA